MFGTEKENKASTRPYHWIVDKTEDGSAVMWLHIAEAVELTMDIPFAGPIQPMVKPFFQFTLTIPFYFDLFGLWN